MDVLPKEWIQKPEIEVDILSYVIDVRDLMEKAKPMVEENARELKLSKGLLQPKDE